MPVSLPETAWPTELLEDGPAEDPSILLSGVAEIGKSPHRLVAVRLNQSTLAVDYRPDVDQAIYSGYRFDDWLEELAVLDDIDKSVLVAMAGGYYVVWMMPFSEADRD